MLRRDQDDDIDDQREDGYRKQHPGQPSQRGGQRDKPVGSGIAFPPALSRYFAEVFARSFNVPERIALLTSGEEQGRHHR